MEMLSFKNALVLLVTKVIITIQIPFFYGRTSIVSDLVLLEKCSSLYYVTLTTWEWPFVQGVRSVSKEFKNVMKRTSADRLHKQKDLQWTGPLTYLPGISTFYSIAGLAFCVV